MKKRTVIKALALVLLVLTVFLACSCNGGGEEVETEAPKLLVKALRVKVDAAAGENLGIKDVEVVEVERTLAPDDYLIKTSEVIGRTLLVDVKAGDVIGDSMLAVKKEINTSDITIPLAKKLGFVVVTDYLDAWNGDEDITVGGVTLTATDRQDVKYTDTLSLIITLINTMIDIVSYALIAFTSVSLVVSTVMIGIITYVSVVERIKEIGVIRSLGGRKKDVSRLFTAETAIIGLLAGLIGVGVTYGVSAIVNAILYPLTGIASLAQLPLAQAGLLVALSVVLTLISGVFPARAAAKKDPVVALRTE